MAENVIEVLRRNIRGDVLVSYGERMPFSTDESIFTLLPAVVVAPKSEDDVRVVLEVARERELPVTCRGGGTGVAGQSIGSGIVLDFRAHFGGILGFSANKVRVQPGVVLADLNAKLADQGRQFAPDPGSQLRCTIGGMIATNASGPRGFAHGSTRKHVVDLTVMLADGQVSKGSSLAGPFEALTAEVVAQKGAIDARWPRVRKNSSGYHLPALLGPKPDYNGLLVGSEGTLAVTLEAELKTVALAETAALAVLGFDDLESAVRAVPELRARNPLAIELLDEHILEAIERGFPGSAAELGLSGRKASLWVEWDAIPRDALPGSAKAFQGWDERNRLFGLRSQASKLLHAQAGKRQPLRCIEDTVVPVEHLWEYVQELKYILLKHDCDGAVFGHAGDGHLHVNPSIDVTQARLWPRIEALMSEVTELVFKYGGSISGEHGDGVLRTNHAQEQWAFAAGLFASVKEAFDPKGILNPGKKWVRTPKAVHPPLRKFRL